MSITEFHSRMWKLIIKNAQGKTGEQVVAALHRASDKVYACGIDQAYAGLALDDALAHAFDFTWMTAFNIELTHELSFTEPSTKPDQA